MRITVIITEGDPDEIAHRNSLQLGGLGKVVAAARCVHLEVCNVAIGDDPDEVLKLLVVGTTIRVIQIGCEQCGEVDLIALKEIIVGDDIFDIDAARHEGVGTLTTGERVLTRATVEDVVAAIAEEDVVAIPADKHIIAFGALNGLADHDISFNGRNRRLGA